MARTQKQLESQKKASAAAKEAGALFKPGQSGNPGGKPLGSRNRLQGKFLATLADDFDAHGEQAIKNMRESDPSSYIRAIASLMPKEMEIKRPIEDLSDAELAEAIGVIQSYLATQKPDKGARAADSGKQAGNIPPLH